MERYQFIVLLGRVEVLREEILANTKEAAIEVASAALNRRSRQAEWPGRQLDDSDTDRRVWTLVSESRQRTEGAAKLLRLSEIA